MTIEPARSLGAGGAPALSPPCLCAMETLIYSSRCLLLLLQVGGWEGDGFWVPTKTMGYLTRRLQTHPHPNPPLEGEGSNKYVPKEPLNYSSRRLLLLLQGGGWEGDGFCFPTKTMGYLTRRLQTHPHPNPPLEGEGSNKYVPKEPLNYSSRRLLLLLQGGGWEGDGFCFPTKTMGYLTRRLQTHPHPNPPLEGEGNNKCVPKEPLNYSSRRLLLLLQGGGWEGDRFWIPTKTMGYLTRRLQTCPHPSPPLEGEGSNKCVLMSLNP
jgi:hypothetical protein